MKIFRTHFRDSKTRPDPQNCTRTKVRNLLLKLRTDPGRTGLTGRLLESPSTDFTLLWLVNLEGFVAFWTTIVLRTFLRWHVTPAWEVRWTKHIWIFWQKADVFIYFNGTSMKLEVFKWPILASSSLFNCSKCWSWQKLSWASKKRTFTTKACQRLCLKNR